jgi:hypothetical protein
VAEPLLFDARIEGLLREIAADPESSLLRVPRPARIGVVLERAPLVGIATAGLRLAEQELVRAHRGEVAYLLRKLAIVRLFESPKAAISRTKTNFASQPALEVERSKWLESAEAFAAEHPSPPEEADSAEELLLRCMRTSDEIGGVSVTAIAAAANQLEPTDQARIYAAQWLGCDEDDTDQARRILLAVLNAGASSTLAASAKSNVARLESRAGSPRSACEWYSGAAALCRSNTAAAFSCLTTTFDSCDSREAERAATFVDGEFRRDDACVADFVALTQAQLRAAHLLPTRPSYEVAELILAKSHGAAGSIAHAYLNQHK